MDTHSWQNTQDISFLTQLAITAATSLNWEEAIKINQRILKYSQGNVEALNRLARAYVCLGNLQEAKKVYAKVLQIDPYNIIARKNLDRVSQSSGNNQLKVNLSPNVNLTTMFLFEPGKTKMINLLNLAPAAVLATLNCGDQVLINPKSHSVAITTTDNVYLGALPDDLAHRIIAFIGGGNKYEAYVKTAAAKSLTVFIREIFKAPKFESQPSFQYQSVFSDDTDYSLF